MTFARAALASILPVAAAPPSERVPVVVELFSSEGCSSCPPAESALAAIDRTQPIDGVSVLALEEHVDYWDDLGWKDPFSRADFTRRQRAYAGALENHGVFTPETVTNCRLRAMCDGAAHRRSGCAVSAPRSS